MEPRGAILQLIETAWNVYCWVRENAQRIFGLVQAIVDSISNIVAGNISGAANFIEVSLAKLIPVAISLFADLLGLGGIADKIRSIIEKVQDKVDHAIDKLIERVMAMFKGKDGKKDDDKKQDPDPNVAGTSAEPLVEVPFEMAGESHTLYIQPQGDDIAISMASIKMPFEQKFPKVVEALDLFQAYVSTIEDPDVQAQFAKKLEKLNKVRSESKSTYAAAYKAIFPGGGQGSQSTPEREHDKVKAAVQCLEQQLENLRAWAAENGITDLTKEQMDKTTEAIAKDAWDKGFEAVRTRLANTIAKYSYKSAPIRFVGSAQTGRTGPHKGKVRFDASDFDVDMNVANASDFAAAAARSSLVNGKIFPNMPGYPGELRRINTAVVVDLVATFPNVGRIGGSSIALVES